MLKVEGIIVRCEESERAKQRPRYELACYFTDLVDDDRDLVEQYVAWRALRRLPTADNDEPARTRRRSAAS
jgi:hypothetical protein